jgi:sortase A
MGYAEVVKFLIIRTIGNFLVLFALYGLLATFGPALYFEASYKLIQARGVKYIVTTTKLGELMAKEGESDVHSGNPSLGKILTGPTQQILIPPDTEFSIVIPKIGASARVFANVDPTDEKNFLPILFKGVAHARGTVFPGISGTTYLFAHSADNFWDVGRYNAVFYLLKDLNIGDEVIVFFHNKRYNYIVAGQQLVDPSNTSAIMNSHDTREQLILQTCWPPGTTWKRLLIYAKPK